jgi:predicted nucleic acid-binding protein
MGGDLERAKGFARFGNLRAQFTEGKAPQENRTLRAVLVDSDILIEVSRARNRAILERWDKLGRGDSLVLCSPVTIAELWHGARPREYQALRALFAAMTPIPIDAEVGQRAGEYLRQYARSHHVELGDALIAATVFIHRTELWTRNRRHYPMKGLLFYPMADS